jgi:hypothetical protein
VRVYHRTDAGDVILAEGFKNGRGTYMTTTEHDGVWFSDTPLGINEGVLGRDLLVVEIPEELIADDEWVEEHKPYREWKLPAELVNRYPVSRVVEDEDGEDGWAPEGWV